MKYLSVCSGIEAATVAWHGLGWRPVAFAEIEAFPAAVLAHHYPTVPNLGDMTKYRDWPEELLAEVDLLVGGTPCQAFSVAGLRRSLDDERGNLSLTYVNLYHQINEVRKRHGRSPAIALWENVPGVLSTKDNAFGCFIGGLLGCDESPETEKGKWDKAGFISSETVRVGYRVLDAQYFGVAQRRRRVFLAAVPSELVERFGERACPTEILSLRESVLGNPPTRGAAWEGVARTTAAGLTSSGRGVERCGESRGQGDVVISRGIAVDTYNQTISDTSIPVRVGNAKDSLPAVIDSPYPCIDANIDAKWGCDQWVNGGYGILAPKITEGVSKALVAGKQQRLDSETETFVVEGHPDPAYAISAGQQGKGGVFGSGRDSQDTFVTCFHPTQDPICSSDGSAHAMGTGSKGGCSSHAIAATQYGGVCGSLTARHDSSPCADRGQNIVAIQERAICENPQAGPDGVGVRDDGVSYTLESRTVSQSVAFKESQSGCRTGEVHATIDANRGSRRVEGVVGCNMQVRRLCPSECEALQGFPIGYTDVTYRKKPACDGPRYRALGNSMAVPCMWWLGYRIQKATE